MPDPAPGREGRADRLRAWLEHPSDSAPRPSADGTTIYLISDRPGRPAAFRVPVGGGAPIPFADDGRRVGRIQPAPVGDRVVVATDRGGDERWALSAHGTGTARPLTDRPDRIHAPGAWRDGRTYVFGSNERDVRFFDVYEVDTAGPGAPVRIRTEDALIDVVAARGPAVLLGRNRTNLDRDLLLLGPERELLLNPRSEEETVFDADLTDEAVYAASNRGRDRAALFRYPRGGGTPELLCEFAGELETVAADRAGERLALVENDRGFGRLYVLALGAGALTPVPLPGDGIVGSVAWTTAGDRLLFHHASAELGVRVYRSDLTGGPSVPLLPERPLPAPGAVPRLADFVAEDGLGVPYWEHRPPGGDWKATVVDVHGGPESQARPGFLPVVQFLRNEGYRVIRPNVRGSLGYGRRYVHLDDVRRRMDSVRDLRDLVGHLRARDRGDGRPAAPYGVIGGSYGGFMVLASLTTYPELFDAGVDLVGISNFLTFLERTGPWRRSLREAEYGSLEHDREFLRSISPLFRAEAIRVPLFVVHGANDPRVPVFEAEQIVAALEARGVAVEFLRFDDEGHGVARRENQLAAYTRAAAFFDRHLGTPA